VIPRPEAWSSGPLPTWRPDAAATVDALVANVPAVGRPLAPAFEGARPSAVLLALVDGAEGPEVLLTKRSMALRNHRGEISFPGGRMDLGETPVETALREAHEEVGLDPSLVTFHGELDHLDTVVSRSYIVPLVARLARRVTLAPASVEVDRVMWVPIADLTRSGAYRAEWWGAEPTDRLIHFFELADETIWGATARILVDLLERR
jgi:8-oxo-dGTP pyrophosphatase MutT (NUDIX family)